MIDPLGEAPIPPIVITVIRTAGIWYFAGAGVSLAIYAGTLTGQCQACLTRVANYVNDARNRVDPCVFQDWLRNAKPGEECTSLCGQALINAIQAFMGQLFGVGGFRPVGGL